MDSLFLGIHFKERNFVCRWRSDESFFFRVKIREPYGSSYEKRGRIEMKAKEVNEWKQTLFVYQHWILSFIVIRKVSPVEVMRDTLSFKMLRRAHCQSLMRPIIWLSFQVAVSEDLKQSFLILDKHLRADAS